jgi:hypothetical protein
MGEPCSSFRFVPATLSLKVDILVCAGAGLFVGESMGADPQAAVDVSYVTPLSEGEKLMQSLEHS